jgi:hypothetical protein
MDRQTHLLEPRLEIGDNCGVGARNVDVLAWVCLEVVQARAVWAAWADGGLRATRVSAAVTRSCTQINRKTWAIDANCDCVRRT